MSTTILPSEGGVNLYHTPLPKPNMVHGGAESPSELAYASDWELVYGEFVITSAPEHKSFAGVSTTVSTALELRLVPVLLLTKQLNTAPESAT